MQTPKPIRPAPPTRRPPGAEPRPAARDRKSDGKPDATRDAKADAETAEVAARLTFFQPVRPRRVFEEIVVQIRRELASGNLRPGDRLPAERDLARQLGASRTAVREAFRSLENAGVIVSRKGVRGGAFIREADPGLMTRLLGDLVSLGSISIDDLTEARVHMLDAVVQLACARGQEADFAAMGTAVEATEHCTKLSEAAARQQAIGAFYDALARASGNEVMVVLVRAVTEILRGILLEVSPMPKLETVATFRSIVGALRRRDEAGARDLMRGHLHDLHEHLRVARDTKRFPSPG